MRVLTIVGARPQFIKAMPVGRALRHRHREVVVHTGQHYDAAMSEIFFKELDLPRVDYHLGVGSANHAAQTGQMMMALEPVIRKENPDVALVYGDTNSTLAGALAAAKMGIAVAHVEAGCRSYDRTMPEEVNRVVTDHVSTLLFCPTKCSAENLQKEGITKGVHVVGDVMYDLFLDHHRSRRIGAAVLTRLKLTPGRYLVATIHRAGNTDSPERLARILEILEDLGELVIFPVHPRTSKVIDSLGRKPTSNVCLIEPLGYAEMQDLLGHARLVLTDSGGVQKEAFFLGRPCLTLRETSEWTETVEVGWNRLVGVDAKLISEAVRTWKPQGPQPQGLFGDGSAAERIVEALEQWHGREA